MLPTYLSGYYRAHLIRGEVLEMRDPNDNSRSRYQWRMIAGVLHRRRLPDKSDAWADIGIPDWEPCGRTYPDIHPLGAFARARTGLNM
jgi:hypothetical protein